MLEGVRGWRMALAFAVQHVTNLVQPTPRSWTPPQKYLGHKSIGIWRVDAPHHRLTTNGMTWLIFSLTPSKVESAYVFDPEFVTAVLLRRTAVMCVRSFFAAERRKRVSWQRTQHMPIVRSEPCHRIAVQDNDEDK